MVLFFPHIKFNYTYKKNVHIKFLQPDIILTQFLYLWMTIYKQLPSRVLSTLVKELTVVTHVM